MPSLQLMSVALPIAGMPVASTVKVSVAVGTNVASPAVIAALVAVIVAFIGGKVAITPLIVMVVSELDAGGH